MDIDEIHSDELKKIFEINDTIENNEPEKLRQLLENAPEYLDRPVFLYGSNTLLGYAASNGSSEICKLLIELGANVDQLQKIREGALQLAAARGFLDVVKLLISAGAKVDGPEKSIISPLMSAAILGHAEVVKYLLDSGADPDRFHLRLNETALDSALIWKRPEIEKILRSVNAKSILEGEDWSGHRSGKFLTWLEHHIGRILPVCFDSANDMSHVELRLALANKKKNKLLFTIGISEALGEPFELGVILPKEWNPYDFSSENLFPIRLLESLSARALRVKAPIEGTLASRDDDDIKGLDWPAKLSAVWIGKRLAEDNPLVLYGDKVQQMEFFGLVPVKTSGAKYPRHDPGVFQDLSFTKLTLPISN